MRTFWLTGSSSGQPWWMLSWGSNAFFLHCSNLLGNVSCNHKMRRQKKSSTFTKSVHHSIAALFKTYIVEVMRFFVVGSSLLVFAFSFRKPDFDAIVENQKKMFSVLFPISHLDPLDAHISKTMLGEELFQIIPKLRIDW